MTFETVANNIRIRWRDEVAVKQNPDLPTEYDNFSLRDDLKDPTNLWARVSIRPAANNQVEMGSKRLFRLVGVVIVQIFSPINKGMEQSNQLVDAITTAFRAITVGGITYRTPTPEHIGRSDNWYQLNVKIPFFTDDRET